ncbi:MULTISPECIES: site-specific integrase [unclassified Polaribacter]|uniref:site-specific integrase n=1 Tax=unclassified Polaribacter TaxID=196858 RepID=UPI0011BEE300|nr:MULTISPECIES: site-specific integrase [unclassified Polaribacter]TXD53602.1 site-specific integrase [Polaribacter sp. IC063]TXD62157.1 site-specific integrase [Polaribacter sp. IC066]
MNNYKLSILFLLQKVRINKQGKCPIRCRITYFKTRKIFSTGLFINPDNWDSGKQKASPPNTENTILNNKLSLIHQQIDKAFLMLQILPNDFDVDDIYRKYKGEDSKEEITILGAYDLHNDKTKKLIGIDFNELSWSRYLESRRKLALFISKFYKRKDVRLKDLDLKFIQDLEYFFKTVLKLKQATVYRSIQRVKKIIQFAISENYLKKDPFHLYKNKKYKTVIVYLTDEELTILEKHTFSQIRLQQVKDLFVFCCYTGLAYTEMTTLKTNNIEIGFDGNEWIQMIRKKTNRKISVPVLPKAKEILEKYDNELPSISNQKFNSYLKEISELLSIDKKLTHHTARKTFATTVLLFNDVPMEIVSELLGHTNMNVTQAHYGKIVKKKVSEQMNILKNKL